MSWLRTIVVLVRAMFRDRRELAAVIARHKPDVAHFHNTHFMISPSAYHACREAGVPVIQSLYNPRLMCPAATFYRQGKAIPFP